MKYPLKPHDVAVVYEIAGLEKIKHLEREGKVSRASLKVAARELEREGLPELKQWYQARYGTSGCLPVTFGSIREYRVSKEATVTLRVPLPLKGEVTHARVIYGDYGCELEWISNDED